MDQKEEAGACVRRLGWARARRVCGAEGVWAGPELEESIITALC